MQIAVMPLLNVPWPANPDYYLSPIDRFEVAPCDGVFLLLKSATSTEPEQAIYIDHSHAGENLQDTVKLALKGRPHILHRGADTIAYKIYYGTPPEVITLMSREVHELRERFGQAVK